MFTNVHKRKRINRTDLFWESLGFFACMTYVWPYYFSVLFAGSEAILNLMMRYVSYLITFMLFISIRSTKKTILKEIKFLSLFLLLGVILFVSTSYNKGDTSELPFVYERCFAFSLLLICAVANNRIGILKGMAGYYKIVIAITFLTSIFPVIHFEGVYNFLSTKNVYFRAVYLGILIIAYVEYEEKKEVSWNLIKWLLLVLITTICINSSTAAFSTGVVLLLLILFKISKSGNVVGVISFRNMILVSLAIAVLVIFMQNMTFYSGFIESVFKKDITFTGRTTLWAQALMRIVNHPILGIGHISSSSTSLLFGESDVWIGSSCHNLYLDIMVETGLLGTAVMGTVFFSMSLVVDQDVDKKRRQLFAALFLAYFISYNFEIYFNGGQSIYLIPPILFVYLIFTKKVNFAENTVRV